MVVADSPLTREAVLEKVRARMLAAARRGAVREEAEDLTQEALIVLTTKYAHVEAPEELVALGITILKKKQLALWGKTERRRRLNHDHPLPSRDEDGRNPAEDVVSEDPGPEEVVLRGQRMRVFLQALGRLDGRCRDLLRRRVDGESSVEIAASLGRPVNTVYSWDSRCRKRLKKLLGAQWGFGMGKEGP